MGGGWPSASKSFAMPTSKFQSDVLRLLAAQRSPDSYVSGGIARNRQGPRCSADIDIFHDSTARLESGVKADEATLAAAGYTITRPPTQRTDKRVTTIAKEGEHMELGWVTASALRFFPHAAGRAIRLRARCRRSRDQQGLGSRRPSRAARCR
jgi:hypothetical protein